MKIIHVQYPQCHPVRDSDQFIVPDNPECGIDCNQELTNRVGLRMTRDEFNDRYDDKIQDRVEEALSGTNPGADEEDDEYKYQRDMIIENENIVFIDGDTQ